MKKITRTVYGNEIQTCLLLNQKFKLREKTTLNELFDVQAGTLPEDDKIPTLKYLAIGNGGHTVKTGPGGVQYTDAISHATTDASCFNHLPFVLREVNNDLSVDERKRYGLRKEVTYNGVNYFAYYLKRLYLEDTLDVQMLYNVVQDGNTSQTPFVPTTDNLKPHPVITDNTGSVTTNSDYLSVSALMEIAFSKADVDNLKEVSEIIYGIPDLAIVSEIALCTGADRVVSGQNAGGAPFNYIEAVAVQVSMFIATYHPVAYTNKGFDFQLNVGKTEPLYSIEDGA